MTNPFQGRALGARQAGPQFPQRRARKKKVPGYFLGGLFSGSPATSSTESHNTAKFGVTDPNYNALMGDVLKRGLSLSNKPYEAYTGQGVVPLTADQNASFAGVRNAQGNYQPYFNQAGDAISRAVGADPTAAGMGYVDQAGNMQSGTQAASPFINQASQTFPGAAAEYMSPYTDSVVNRIADLGNRNLTENILPAVNDTFTGGGAAQFGRERHADITGRAIRDTGESIMGQQAQALEQGYQTAGNLFNQDANRAAGLAGTSGALANADTATRAGLGQTAAGITATGANTGVQAGQAAAGLGQATQGAALTDANALSASGAQQQTQAQNEETWKYNQFKEKQQDPFQKALFGQGISQGWTLPTQTSSDSNSSTTQTQAQGSPFGQILGGATSLLGAAGGLPGLSSLGSLFGGGAAGSGTLFAQGGMVPSISAMRQSFAPPQGQGAMPTGMPGMPPMPTLAPQLPQGQPNGQPASPFARGGYTGDDGDDDLEQDVRMIVKAVHEHERNMHKGSPFTKLRFGA